MTLVEICVDDVAGARVAEECGADRIELCADLLEGGITPSYGMVTAVLETTSRVGVQLLIRPRGGDFVYSPDEVRVMLTDIRLFAGRPRVGFVLSGLTATKQVDAGVLATLVEACGDAPVTFSRAFDEITDQFGALDTLASLGVSRVLTGGGRGRRSRGATSCARWWGTAGIGSGCWPEGRCGRRTWGRSWRIRACPRCICGRCGRWGAGTGRRRTRCAR